MATRESDGPVNEDGTPGRNIEVECLKCHSKVITAEAPEGVTPFALCASCRSSALAAEELPVTDPLGAISRIYQAIKEGNDLSAALDALDAYARGRTSTDQSALEWLSGRGSVIAPEVLAPELDALIKQRADEAVEVEQKRLLSIIPDVPELHALCHLDVERFGDEFDNSSDEWRHGVHTLSDKPDELGWTNDCDQPGYGLPKNVAEQLVLLVHELRTTLK